MKRKAKFTYSDCVDPFAPQTNYTEGQKAFTVAYLYLIIAIMVFVLIYSFAINLQRHGIERLLDFGFPIISVAISSLILILSAHGKWKSFLNKLGTNKLLTEAGLNAELEEYKDMYDDIEKKKADETAIIVLDNALIVRIDGVDTLLKKDDILKINIIKVVLDFYINISSNEKVYKIPLAIPLKYLARFLSFFDCDKEVIRKSPEKIQRRIDARAVLEKIGKAIVPLIFVSAGVVLVLLSSKNIIPIPEFFGSFFLFGGLLALINVMFGESEYKSSVNGILAGLMFTIFPVGICLFVMELNGINGFMELFIATPEIIMFIMLFMLGAMFIPICLYTLIRTIILRIT